MPNPDPQARIEPGEYIRDHISHAVNPVRQRPRWWSRADRLAAAMQLPASPGSEIGAPTDDVYTDEWLETSARLNGYSNVELLNVANGAFPGLDKNFWPTVVDYLIEENISGRLNGSYPARDMLIDRLAVHLQTRVERPNANWQKKLPNTSRGRDGGVRSAQLESLQSTEHSRADRLPDYRQNEPNPRLRIQEPASETNTQRNDLRSTADTPVVEGNVTFAPTVADSIESNSPLQRGEPQNYPRVAAPGASPSSSETILNYETILTAATLPSPRRERSVLTRPPATSSTATASTEQTARQAPTQ